MKKTEEKKETVKETVETDAQESETVDETDKVEEADEVDTENKTSDAETETSDDEDDKEDKQKKSKEKDTIVLVHKTIKLVTIMIAILIFAAAFLGFYLMSREGVIGLIRQLLIPIALGAFGYAIVFLFLNFLAGRMKKGHRGLYILREIVQYVVIILIGYAILNPVKDLIHGADTLEVNIVSRTLDAKEAGILLSSNGNEWIDSKYHMTITIYGKMGAEDEIYKFPVDLDTYNYFRDNQDSLYFEIEYYKNTNILKSCKDITDEVLNELFGGLFEEQNAE